MDKERWVAREAVKMIGIRCVRIVIRMLYWLPLKDNRVFFFSFNGSQYSCNPRAISEYLEENAAGKYEIIWAFRKPASYEYLRNRGIRIVRFRSLTRVILQVRSKYCINNSGAYSWIPVRKGQYHVNTWHAGGAYKRLQSDGFANRNRMLTARETTHMVSSAEYFTKYMIHEQFRYYGKVLETGLPRNDVFFDPVRMRTTGERVRKELDIPDHAFVVLYAPTWRYDNDIPCPDFRQVLAAVRERFGREGILLVRSHNLSTMTYKNVIDVTSYPDMQDLLCLADMLITDYSSSIWDYSFTYRPCFLFVSDLDKYIREQGFFVDIHSWGFPLCPDDASLVKEILSFDESRHKRNMDRHHQVYGSFENGNAARRFCSEIFGIQGSEV